MAITLNGTTGVTAAEFDGALDASNLTGINEVISTNVDSQFNVSGSAPKYACRAWVNFNGSGTIAIRASGNVSSITDNGSGDYTVNFTIAMPDANYAVFGSSQSQAESSEGSTVCLKSSSNTSAPVLMTASAVRLMRRGTFNENRTDGNQIHVSVFR